MLFKLGDVLLGALEVILKEDMNLALQDMQTAIGGECKEIGGK